MTVCPACGRVSITCYRCEHCGRDLVDVDDNDDDDDGSSAAPLVADGGMERVTFRAPADQLEQLETLVERGEYPNRSEAMRTALQKLLAEDHTDYSDRLRGPDGDRLRSDGGQPADKTGRPGELERFAVDCALRAAWATEFRIPGDPDFGFVDYVEAAATRNLGLLRGFEDLAEDAARRGILPQTDSDQTRLVTDGGHVGAHATDRDPRHNPRRDDRRRWTVDEVRSQRRSGHQADQGPCPHVPVDDDVPCPACFFGGGATTDG